MADRQPEPIFPGERLERLDRDGIGLPGCPVTIGGWTVPAEFVQLGTKARTFLGQAKIAWNRGAQHTARRLVARAWEAEAKRLRKLAEG